MPSLKNLLKPESYVRFLERAISRIRPNFRGITAYPPGHAFSPLLDIENIKPGSTSLPHDGTECWACLDLQVAEQRSYYQDLFRDGLLLPFPKQKADGFRYYSDNHYFPLADALTLSAIMQKEKPKLIVEVGSGYSSSVMLDTMKQTETSIRFIFIEPYPERLYSLLTAADKVSTTILAKPVQQVDLALFDQLEAGDILFIDSTHVAKIGSDVTFLLLQVLPRLKRGVLVHVHDIFYPQTYPIEWLQEGRAWNESLFLRAFLTNNSAFEIIAFNGFAVQTWPELFQGKLSTYLENSGSSIWIRKCAEPNATPNPGKFQ